MAKVFDGKGELAENTCELKFSNGFEISVIELCDEAVDIINNNAKQAEAGTLELDVKSLRQQLATMLGVDVEKLEGVGFVELRRASDFLLKSLFE